MTVATMTHDGATRPTALVTGANKGLGLEFVRQLARTGWRVHACCRNPDAATELKKLAKSTSESITIHCLDVADLNAAEKLAAMLGDDAIDLLVNNAGIIDATPTSFSESSRTAVQALGGINYHGWAEVFGVNVIGTMRLTEALLPHVARSSRKMIVMISSVMGSITANDPDNFPPGGGIYIYRSSKAALNMVARTLAADLRVQGITVLSLNPGWVKTDMGGKDGMFTPETSVGNMIGIIENSRFEMTGSFVSHDGKSLPW